MEYIINDSAIYHKNDDVFNFSYYADKLNKIIQANSSNPDPIVIGIQGKWGDGKTSFMNLVKEGLSNFSGKDDDKRILKYEFNPWRYSNEDEMLFDFFDGLSKTLLVEDKGKNLKQAGKYILKFSRYLKAVKLSATVGLEQKSSPLKFGSSITFEPYEILKALGEDLNGEKLTLDKIKKQIDEELLKSNYKVAIYIDDIDRLDKDEIYTLLKIIKLNANFNNLIYIITLDPNQVAKAIHHRYGANIQDGELFLEKIINIPIILPKIENEDLQLFFDKKISNLNRQLALNKDTEFKEIAFEFRKFQFNTPREIIRVINSFAVSAYAIGEEVNLRDLFWIEYLKIKSCSCYNDIKNYSEETQLFSGMQGVIDFNDDFNPTENPNGFRKELFTNYPHAKEILNHLFPDNTRNKTSENTAHSKLLEKDLRINSSEHFDKYFSYHTLRKISVSEFKNIKNLIKDRSQDELSNSLVNLFRRHAEYKTLYKIEEIIDTLEPDDFQFFCKFLFSDISIIPDLGEDMFGRSFRIRIIEKVAIKLNDEYAAHVGLIMELSNYLELNHLCYFTRKFENGKPFKQELYNIIVAKVQMLSKPFFENPYNAPNKMIMQIWKNNAPTTFDNYLMKNLTKENILLFIRNFPAFWNNSHFGPLTFENYTFLKSIFDVDILFKSLKEYQPELFNGKINQETIDTDNSDENSIEENALQFIHWYKKDKGEKDKRMLLL